MKKLTDKELQIQYLMNQIKEKKEHVEWLKNDNGSEWLKDIHISNCKREIRILCDILESVGVSNELANALKLVTN